MKARLSIAVTAFVLVVLGGVGWALDLQQAIPVAWYVRDDGSGPLRLHGRALTSVVAAAMVRYGGMPRDARFLDAGVRVWAGPVKRKPTWVYLRYVPTEQNVWRYFVIARIVMHGDRPVVVSLDRHWEPPVVRELARWWYDRTAPLAPMPASVTAACRVDLAAVRRIAGQRFVHWASMGPSDNGMRPASALRMWDTLTAGSPPDGVLVRWRVPWRPAWDPTRRIDAAFIRREGDDHAWNVVVLRSPRSGSTPASAEGTLQALDESPCAEGKPSSGA